MKKFLFVLILSLIPFSAYGKLDSLKPLTKADKQEIVRSMIPEEKPLKVVELQVDLEKLKIYLDGELIQSLPDPNKANLDEFFVDKESGKIIVLKFVTKK